MSKRELPWVDYRLLAVDGEQLEKANQRLAETRERLRHATLRFDKAKPDRVKEKQNAAAAVKRAEAAFEACWEKIRLTAMRPDEFEELKAAHPPTAEQLKDDAEFNRDTLRPALLEACAAGGLTARQWETRLADEFSAGERQEIFATALAINEGSRVVESVVLPKGSIGTKGSLLNLR